MINAENKEENKTTRKGLYYIIAELVVKRPWYIIAFFILLFGVAGMIGGGVTKRLTNGGFEYKQAESVKARTIMQKSFGQKISNLVILITAKDGNVDSDKTTKAALKISEEMKSKNNIENIFSYWSINKPASLKSKDGKQALILAIIKDPVNEKSVELDKLAETFMSNDDIVVGVTGGAEINRQFNINIEKDLAKAEMIAIPITLIILVFVFRSVVAALLPVIIGVFAITGSLLVLYALTFVTDVSVYALNLTTMLGLGLAIDYSLFIVSRFRENLALGLSVNDSVKQTVLSAGRTTVFSALTVAVSLLSLLVFHQAFLKSFAYAGLAVSLVAALGSILLLPAILRILGKRVNAGAISKNIQDAPDSIIWGKVGERVMKRPWRVAILAIIFLLFLGYPFLKINLGQGDERGLPASNPVRLIQQDIRNNFASQESSAINIVSEETNIDVKSVKDYVVKLSNIDGIDHVESAIGLYSKGEEIDNQPLAPMNDKGILINAILSVPSFSPEGEKIARTIRKTDAPFPVLVGGNAADLVDIKDSLINRLPLAITLIAVATFLLLFFMFGSIFVPFKALVINFISLSATFGVMVWVFQEGHLSQYLHFTANGMIEATMPVLMFCVAFGMSMDYEVFLLSRIKEHYDATGDNKESIIYGLRKTGGIISAAAVLISIVFIAFASSGILVIKLMGSGLAMAVLLDAFLIRGTLVPAFMRLAGKANWWMPNFLRSIYNKFRITE